MKLLIDGQTLLTPEINRGIGTYFKHVVENLLAYDFRNDYYLNIADEAQLSHLSPWARNRVGLLVNRAYDPRTLAVAPAAALMRAYSDALNNDLEREGIDAYWTPNALMGNVSLPRKESPRKFAVTVHDLIVMVLEDVYLRKWPRPAVEMYRRKIEILEQDYDLFLHDSEHTKADCLRLLNVADKTHVTALLGVSEQFRPYPFPQVPAGNDYALYLGGFDPRKNMHAALAAFALMLRKHGRDGSIKQLRLKIICRYDEAEKNAILTRARESQIEERVELLGFVADRELPALYQKARCFFFPSRYEGFGLPVLEALACGIPVAAANTSSLPEVGGPVACYFDPANLDDMAATLYQATQEPQDWRSRQRRYAYSKKFSWPQTASVARQAFERLLYGSSHQAELSRARR